MTYHVFQWAGVDVGVMNAAIFSISVFPTDGTVMMFAEPSRLLGVYDGAKHTKQNNTPAWKRIRNL